MCFEKGFKSRQCGGQPDMSRQLLAEFVLGTNKSTWVNNKILKSILKRAGSQRRALASICSVHFHLFAGTDFISQTIQSCQNAKKRTDLYYSLQVFTGRMCGGFVGLWGMTSVFLKTLATALSATGPKSKWHHSNLPLIGGNWTYNSPLMQRLHNSITHSL